MAPHLEHAPRVLEVMPIIWGGFRAAAPGILEQSAQSILAWVKEELLKQGLLCIAAMSLSCYLLSIWSAFAGIGMVPFPKSHKNFLHSCFLLCIFFRILAVGEQILVLSFSSDCFST